MSRTEAANAEQELAPPSAGAVEAGGLTVRYGSRPALGGVSLTIPRGGITAIVGPSGCGKSTFLFCLNRLTDLLPGCRVEGSLRVGGIDVLDPACNLLSLRRRVGMVFQKPNPFPLSVRRNFSLPLREHGVSRDEIEGQMETSLRDVGLWDEVADRLDLSATRLSGGQQQRLCLARALCLRPDVLLCDEPCSALDPLASGVVEDLIASLRDRVTVVIVTHNLAQARRMADHLAIFWVREGAGTVIEAGPAKAVFDTPADPVAASYLEGRKG